MTKMNFNDFAKCYCGTNDREEQIEELKDALINVDTDCQISEAELNKLFDTKCQIRQVYFEPNDYFDIVINGTWACMSIIKIII